MNLNEEFQVHDTLNPKLWDTKTNILLPDIREALLNITYKFEELISIPIAIVDVQLCGSNASFNYTEHSDIDLHVIANFEAINQDEVLLQALYNAKKTSFNNDYDITIKGLDVELYVQNIKSTVVSNGIYSICDNTWIKEPKPIKSATKHNTESEVTKWKEKIDQIVKSGSYENILNAINCLYLIRHNSIAVDGEYGKGNQIFKDIRSIGYLEKLKKALKVATSKQLSVESMSKSEFINKYKD